MHKSELRSIPACTGEPAPPAATTADGRWVYPRVYGGTDSTVIVSDSMDVRVYPRVYGGTSASVGYGEGRARGSIPACTGEPSVLVEVMPRPS